ncbi:MAG: TonB-dependent receptor [Ferruginibacter sp.]
MNKILPFILLSIIFSVPLHTCAQDTINMNEIRVTSWMVNQSLQRTTTAAAIIDSSKMRIQHVASLVPAFNAVPGVRMEERSPGSYRLSLRGSLLRSPFGVRNVKVYFNEFPLTDAGGNTYINVIPPTAISDIEILKGPDGSLFGANSGGVVNIHSNGGKDKLTAEAAGGSYGLFRQNVAFTKQAGNQVFSIAESYQRSDGYRANSKLHRFYIHATDEWRYSKNNTLKLLFFYGDLYYQTPGGLTKAQYDSAPSQSRPNTATLRSAKEQKAAVYNKMFFDGVSHIMEINKHIQNVTAIFASTVDFKNPFITNFEVRKEDTYGARTFFTFSNTLRSMIECQYNIGIEWQQTKSSISNYRNNFGDKGDLVSAGNITTDQHFIFNKLKIDILKKLLIEAGLSVNYYSYRFKDSAQLNNNFKPQWMPRVALSYTALKKITLRASVSKGYSTPTTAEVRPSNNLIYRNLQAETGVNTEAGIRWSAFANRLWIDIAAYQYKLSNAIVQQQDSSGTAYFVNAGGTIQKGLEFQVNYQAIAPAKKGFIKKLQFSNSSTINNFKFQHYSINQSDYSGKNITGVPKYVFVSSVFAETKPGPWLFIQHNHTSNIPLNDGNSFFAKAYDLIQMKLGYPVQLSRCKLELYAGVDNILNVHYSLGNDLNAAGNRFYNAAALRNYFIGFTFSR